MPQYRVALTVQRFYEIAMEVEAESTHAAEIQARDSYDLAGAEAEETLVVDLVVEEIAGAGEVEPDARPEDRQLRLRGAPRLLPD